MTKRMLIDATHPEETRVALINGNKLEEYDYETLTRKELKSNIYLVKVTRVEPSLQAAFVDFGGNRHGFLPFPEIHPDYYRIPIADREALLAEERAIAAAQAAREDAEDAAELAASGESIDDLDEEEHEEHADGGVDFVQSHAGSLAADIGHAPLVDTGEDHAEEHEEHEEEAPAAEISPEAAPAEEGATEEGAAEPVVEENLETVGGDAVDTPVFRSSIKRRYKIQEVIKRNQIMLIQISKEERGNKGAAVTSYISLPGRYCVLMPNSPRGGGVSRKVSNAKDRQRLKQILKELNVPEGMSVILRTAGVARGKAEIKRDLDYLLRLWNQIREFTLQSTAPALIYEEGNLIKRAIRDLYRRDIDELLVAGEDGFNRARDFMRMLMPSHLEKVLQYKDESVPLFFRYQVESQIDAIHSPTVHLKSGGYIVINPTEAMVSIDVNSGRATKGRHIEETALKTNLEAAEEIARQLRLRDQGGLIVIDFIDMEDKRGNRTVEKRLRDAMQSDRARIQLGRISAFGLLELSRQRLHPSLVETNFETCKHCAGSGLVRTVETAAVMVLRAIEEEGLRGRASEIKVSVPTEIALYIFNVKREMLAAVEKRHKIRVFLHADDSLIKPGYAIEVLRASGVQRDQRPQKLAHVQTVDISDLPDYSGEEDDVEPSSLNDDEDLGGHISQVPDTGGEGGGRHRHGRGGGRHENRGEGRRDRGGRGGRNEGRGGRNGGSRENFNGGGRDFAPREDGAPDAQRAEGGASPGAEGRGNNVAEGDAPGGENGKRRRGRRGGRRRGGRNRDGEGQNGQPGGERNFRERGPRNEPQGGIPGEGPQPSTRPESAPAAAASVGGGRSEPSQNYDGGPESGRGDSRKGWWKRLTE